MDQGWTKARRGTFALDTATELYWCSNGAVWNNDGGTAFLLDASGNIVHRVTPTEVRSASIGRRCRATDYCPAGWDDVVGLVRPGPEALAAHMSCRCGRVEPMARLRKADYLYSCFVD